MYKKIILFTLLALPFFSQAERFDITAEIGQVRYHEASNSMAASWKKHIWFGLKNPNKSPNCQQYSGQYAISIPDGNETAISFLLAAKMANKKVIVTIDDSVKFPGGNYCKLQYLTLKN
jgi:hypothetical protein